MILWILSACALAAGAVVLAEVFTRVLLRRKDHYFVNRPHMKTVLELEPCVSAHLEPRVRIEMNSRGERGAEIEGDGRDTLRVAVVGGSAAYCYMVDQPTSWPEKMASYLREQGVERRLGKTRIHVGNISQAELSSGGARSIVDHVLAKDAGLSAAVLMIGISDMLRWLRLGAPERLPPQTAADVFAIHPEGPYSWRPSATALAEVARRVRDRLELRQTPVIHRENVGKGVKASRLKKQNATTVITEVPNAVSMLAEYRRNLSAIVESLLRRRLVVVVLGQPHFDSAACSDVERSQFWNGGVGDPAKGPITTYYADSVLDELSRRVNATTQSVAAELSVPYVDLDRMVPNDLVHYYDQFHFTPAGADVVARAAADELAEALTEAKGRPDRHP
jgi:lysophospholipase L1-like esterase